MPNVIAIGIGVGFQGASAFSPADIANLRMWLKADALSLNDGDAVTSWTDSSGLGNAAVQAYVPGQPTFKTNILNGKPVVRFNGTSNGMTFPDVGLTNAITMFVVSKNVDTGSYHMLVSWGGAVDDELRYELTSGDANFLYAGEQSKIADTTGNFSILCANFTGTSRTVYRNGTAGNTITTTLHGYTSPTIGFRGAFFHKGDIAEIIIYNTSLSAGDILLVQNYLNTKYAIY